MMQDSSMSDMIREMMEKKKGGKDSFTMTGQYTSTVKTEEGPSGETREYVMYESPNGEEIKVYGNWNEYAVSQNEDGEMYIHDDNYPIVQNEKGEYVLDEATFEGQMKGQEMERESTGGPGASRTEDLLERLSQARGRGGAPAPGMDFRKGGKFPDLNKDGKVTMADILKGRGVIR